jgi:hypothetical protein
VSEDQADGVCRGDAFPCTGVDEVWWGIFIHRRDVGSILIREYPSMQKVKRMTDRDVQEYQRVVTVLGNRSGQVVSGVDIQLWE